MTQRGYHNVSMAAIRAGAPLSPRPFLPLPLGEGWREGRSLTRSGRIAQSGTRRCAAMSIDSQTAATLAAVERFGDAFNRQDLDGGMAMSTDDCVFDDTEPVPDGTRFEGQEAVRRAWGDFFASS